MCRHTGLRLVCLACLFLSANPSSTPKAETTWADACNAAKLFEKHANNSSLSLEGLDRILIMVHSTCTSYWKEKKTIPEEEAPPDSSNHVAKSWLYAGVSVLFISACGLAAVALIKVLPSWLFQPAIQFLVALAVGTLTGDAILHLIPHAFATHHSHSSDTLNHSALVDHEGDHHREEGHGHDPTIIWKGVVVLAILAIFFVIERLLNIFGEWRQRQQSSKQVHKVAHFLSESSRMVGEKLCRHHQQNHQGHKDHRHDEHEDAEVDQHLLQARKEQNVLAPETAPVNPDADVLVSCVSRESKEVTFLNNGDRVTCSSAVTHSECALPSKEYNGCAEWQGLVMGKPLIYCASHEICDGSNAGTVESNRDSVAHSEHLVSVKSPADGLQNRPAEETAEPLTVFISEHHTSHHGHSHSHGHIHARPQGVASLAWLVLAGDGMHNLSDGLAIGAAFAADITGGFTTAIAVLCHELPHELGDFAVLLRAGMTIKQAIICNLISSLLCLMGVMVGLAIGSAHHTAPWIFASTAGMFLYIALVDMMPELNGHLGKNRSALFQLTIQLAGLITGFSIMFAIALYERELTEVLQSQL